MKVLVINPGATSTKVAVFEEERELLKKSIVHTAQELEGFERVIDQADFRQRAVLEAVAEEIRAAGGEALRYIPCLNAGDAHADALAALAQGDAGWA